MHHTHAIRNDRKTLRSERRANNALPIRRACREPQFRVAVFVLWKSLEIWQSRAGLGNSPRTVLEELARIQSNDVVLPTASHGQIRLRCITQPDAAQAALLDRLGVVLPKRMRFAEHERPALADSA
jgi:hypothetical protein